jgi:transcription factor C subunit 6
MRTRKSNRTKSFKVEKYDFELSSDEEAAQQPRRVRIAEEKDPAFDANEGAGENSPGDGGSDDDDGSEPVASSSSSVAADSDGGNKGHAASKPRSSAPRTKRAQVQPAGSSDYLHLEQVATDAYAPRGYMGRYGRYARKDNLMRIWYGPRVETIRAAVEMTQWFLRWTLLPPKVKMQVRMPWDRGMCSADFFEREEAYVEAWLERIGKSRTVLSSLSHTEASPYKLSPGKLPVLVGPYDSQSEMTFEPGDAHAISESGLSYQQDENPSKISTGCMFDVGGIVTSLDWARRKDMTQILALAVTPHADQELLRTEENATVSEGYQHGMVQLWECSGEKSAEGFLRPSTQPPKIQKTICLDYGRAKIIKWSPTCHHLAILCSNDTVVVVEPGFETLAAYGK